jgi:hypothetical protein
VVAAGLEVEDRDEVVVIVIAGQTMRRPSGCQSRICTRRGARGDKALTSVDAVEVENREAVEFVAIGVAHEGEPSAVAVGDALCHGVVRVGELAVAGRAEVPEVRLVGLADVGDERDRVAGRDDARGVDGGQVVEAFDGGLRSESRGWSRMGTVGGTGGRSIERLVDREDIVAALVPASPPPSLRCGGRGSRVSLRRTACPGGL